MTTYLPPLAAILILIGTAGCTSPKPAAPTGKEDGASSQAAPETPAAGAPQAPAVPPAPPSPGAPVIPEDPGTSTPPPPAPADGTQVKPSRLVVPPEFLESERRISQAKEALRRGDKPEAERLYEEALALNPRKIEATMRKAQLAREGGRPEEALATLDAALALQPDQPSLLYEKAVILVEQENPSAAMDAILKITETGTRMPSARFLRAKIVATEKDREATLAAIADAVDNGFLDAERIRSEAAFGFLAEDAGFVALVEEVRNTQTERAKIQVSTSAPVEPLPEAIGTLDAREVMTELQYRVKRQRGESVPLDLMGVDGKPLRLADHEEKIVIIAAWGPWSRRSTQQLASIVRLGEAYRDQGVQVLSLCYEPSGTPEAIAESTRAYLKDFKLEIPTAAITKDDARNLRLAQYPCTIFVGRDGKTYLRASGYMSYEDLAFLTDEFLRLNDESLPGPAPSEGPGGTQEKPEPKTE